MLDKRKFEEDLIEKRTSPDRRWTEERRTRYDENTSTDIEYRFEARRADLRREEDKFLTLLD